VPPRGDDAAPIDKGLPRLSQPQPQSAAPGGEGLRSVARILIADDSPACRRLLVELLRYVGHQTLEAADGDEALECVRSQRPQLVISDLVMPTVDGFEFVRRLRCDPAVARTPVVLYSAAHHQPEALALARSCGAADVLTKPCRPDVLFRAVEAALGHVPPAGAPPPPADEFRREHLVVLTDTLAAKVAALEAATLRLAALADLSRELTALRDPAAVLGKVCEAARTLLGARAACAGVLQPDGGLAHFAASPARPEGARAPPRPHDLAALVAPGGATRRRDAEVEPGDLGLAAEYGPVRALLGVSLPPAGPAVGAGWLLLVNKAGADEFSAEDEGLAATLVAHAAVAYENARLHAELRDRAAALERQTASTTRRSEPAELVLPPGVGRPADS
jgi:CheY-like chemotaxis protein